MNKLLSILMIAVIAVAFTGCGDDKKDEPTPANQKHYAVYQLITTNDVLKGGHIQLEIYDPVKKETKSYTIDGGTTNMLADNTYQPLNNNWTIFAPLIGVTPTKHYVFYYLVEGVNPGDEVRGTAKFVAEEGKVNALTEGTYNYMNPSLSCYVMDETFQVKTDVSMSLLSTTLSLEGFKTRLGKVRDSSLSETLDFVPSQKK